MHFEGVFDVAAIREEVFEVVTDPKQVAGCMPGLQKVDVKSPDEFEAVVKVGVSFIRGDFTVRFRTVQNEAPSSAKMTVHGGGLGSAVDMQITMNLTERDAGGTSMKWDADATVSGKIASLGQRLMETQAEKIINQFFTCLREKLERT